MKLFVADAKYRSLNLAYDTTPRSHGNPQLTVTSAYFNGKADIKTKALTYTKNDAWIQSTYAALRNDGTARSNTDNLMKFDTTEAAHHCRNQDIPGVGQLDLPNLYELIILYLESDNIDALDPTVESNKRKALGKMSPNGRFTSNTANGTWASSEASSSHVWGVEGSGCAGHYDPYYGGVIIPVRELDA